MRVGLTSFGGSGLENPSLMKEVSSLAPNVISILFFPLSSSSIDSPHKLYFHLHVACLQCALIAVDVWLGPLTYLMQKLSAEWVAKSQSCLRCEHKSTSGERLLPSATSQCSTTKRASTGTAESCATNPVRARHRMCVIVDLLTLRASFRAFFLFVRMALRLLSVRVESIL